MILRQDSPSLEARTTFFGSVNNPINFISNPISINDLFRNYSAKYIYIILYHYVLSKHSLYYCNLLASLQGFIQERAIRLEAYKLGYVCV